MGSFLRRVDIKPPRVIFEVPGVIRSEAHYDFRLTNEAYERGDVRIHQDGVHVLTITQEGEILLHCPDLCKEP